MEDFGSGERITSILEYSQDEIVILEKEGTISYASPAAERLFGYESEKIRGTLIYSFVHPDDRHLLIDEFQKLLEAPNKESTRVRHRLRHADGSWIGVESIATNYTTSPLRGVLVDIREITESDLQVTDRRQIDKFAMESALSGIAIADYNGELIAVNDASLEMWGYDREGEVVGRQVSEFWKRPPEVKNIGHMLDETGEWEGELIACRKDGSEFAAHCSVSIVSDDEGKPLGTMATFFDISDRKQYERDLALSQTLVDEANDAVYVVDIESGQLLDVNKSAGEMLGYHQEDLLGMSVTDISSEFETVEEYRDLVERERNFGPVENEHIAADGSTVPVEVTAKSVEIDGEKVRIVIGRDITELRQRMRQIEVLDRFLRHNLRNDMNVVLGYAETIAAEASTPHVDYAQSIIEVANSMLSTAEKERQITEILLETPDPEPQNIGLIVRKVVEDARRRYSAAHIGLAVDDGSYGIATAEIGLAIQELIENAVEHSDTDPADVRVEVRNHGGSVEITIGDSGPRIPEMDLEILDGHDRIEPMYHGSGLGLWLVYLVVQRSNGGIDVTHPEGDGNRIAISVESVDPSSVSPD